MYTIVKHVHLTTVALSIVGFLLRLFWQLTQSARANGRLVRVLPHVNDSILFFSGLYLVWLTGQYPWEHGWLAAKVIALLLYIFLGAKALRAAAAGPKLMFGGAGVATYLYMVMVALNKSPWPF